MSKRRLFVVESSLEKDFLLKKLADFDKAIVISERPDSSRDDSGDLNDCELARAARTSVLLTTESPDITELFRN